MAWEDTAKIIQQEAADATQVIIQLIQQRIKRIPEIQQELLKIETELTGGQKLKAAEKRNLLKSKAVGETSLYRLKRDIGKEIDKLNRGLSELLTAEGKESYLIADTKKDGGLFNDLFSKNLRGPDLAKRLAAFETKLSGYTEAVKSGIKRFTVGHHQHLASLRELALEAKKRADPKWWSEYVRKLDELGYEIGDLGIKRLVPIAHKYLQRTKKGELNILGFLQDAGITENTPGFKQLYDKTKEIMAHTGGTGGVKIPSDFANLSVDDAIKASLPYLDIERARTQQGELLTKLIRNWSGRLKGPATTEDLKKLTSVVNRIPTLEVDEFLKKRQLATQTWLAQIDELKNNAVSSGLMDTAMDAVEAAAEQKRYELMAGPLKIFKEGSKTLNRIPLAGKALAALPVLDMVIGPHDVHAGGLKVEEEKGKQFKTPGDKIRSEYAVASGKLQQISGASATVSGTTAFIPGGQAAAAGSGLFSIFTGLGAWRAEHLSKHYRTPLEKLFPSMFDIDRQNIPTGEYNDKGEYSIQIKKTEPRVPNLPFLK